MGRGLGISKPYLQQVVLQTPHPDPLDPVGRCFLCLSGDNHLGMCTLLP
jgi:hypothetical protein